jgi:glycolate oxidase FAD binding subunit
MTDLYQHFKQQISTAAVEKKILAIKGHGSKDFYGRVGSLEVLQAGSLQGIVSYEPSELVVTARAGTSLLELQDVLQKKGQYLPFDPPHYGGLAGTVGGMVAAGLSGPARVAVGGVRDYVLGVSVINGRSQALRFGGQVMKNVAGYDVSRLFVGSMGTLGLLTEVSIKVLPLPPAQATLRLLVSQSRAIERLRYWSGLPLPLNASCWMPVSDAVGANQDGFLYIRLRGAKAAVDSALHQMQHQANAESVETVKIDAEIENGFWSSIANQMHSVFLQPPSKEHALWRLSLPPATSVSNFGDACLIEWHGGVRWYWATAQQASELRSQALKHGGHATLWRPSQSAADEDEACGVFTSLSPVHQRIQQQLQQQFDPFGVFNTGRLGF